ncbi:MAG: ABC transporter ATP-binding protein [Proteobacteria bacterium]|nr:ABC transporter ATP-binding protein [Pseudomonadota bacterium]
METIVLRNVSKIYQTGENRVMALSGVDLTVSKGEILSVMGASGSGKSTMLNILGCLDAVTSGEYVLDGHRVSDLAPNELADIRNRKIGFVFQGFNLLPRTSALENVELPLLYDRSHRIKDPRKEAAAALERVDLGSRLDHIPSQLSGGQQQRVAIARALVTRPAIILADEPTGNLDSRTSLEIMGLFQDLNREGVTILMVTHEPDIASFTERIIEMRDGMVIGDHRVLDRGDAARDLARVSSGSPPGSFPETVETEAHTR